MTFIRTKIICTIGPATDSLPMLRKLYIAGMNVVRINMSHATHKYAASIISKINKINNETNHLKQKIAILLDTQHHQKKYLSEK